MPSRIRVQCAFCKLFIKARGIKRHLRRVHDASGLVAQLERHNKKLADLAATARAAANRGFAQLETQNQTLTNFANRRFH